MRPFRLSRLLPVLVLLLALAGGGLLLLGRDDKGASPATASALACAKTTEGSVDKDAAEEREREAASSKHGWAETDKDAGEKDADASPAGATSESGDAGIFAGPGEAKGQLGEGIPCGSRHPESFRDLALANSSRLSRATAPGTSLKPGAYRNAITQRSALSSTAARDAVNGSTGQWNPYGNSPVETGRTEYDTSNGSTQEGLGNVAGRVSAFARNANSGALYSAVANGGIFRSDNGGDSWSPISDPLPTQIVSGLGWSAANGGTIIALTGDDAFGGSSLGGLGAYTSTDEGRTWKHSAGVPDGLLAFKVAVDPTNPARVYAATGGGLFASTDAGATFTNAVLPTGKNAPAGTPDCSGKAATVKDCFLANMVTDVVVQGAATAKTTNAKPGAVVAAVGWRAGMKKNADGSVQSAGNGVYRSDTGNPGTFANLDIANHNTSTEGLSQAQIGRFALGATTGDGQNRSVLYALISDAVKFNGGAAGLDVNDLTGQSVPNSDVLNGVYVSTDFGTTWKLLEGSATIDADTLSGSALAPPTCKAPIVGYCPGVQGWYNLWVEPDPTKQDAGGVPSRVAFGLEEVWMNDQTVATPLDGSLPARFTVIGRYFAGSTCALVTALNALPVCPFAQGGQVPTTTTHPDQHAAMFVPDGNGGVTLFVGNDGGVYRQKVNGSTAFANTAWGKGQNIGMHTTLPYDVAMAKDGTTYAGLQDNGEMKIDPDGRAYTVFGGDGFFSAVDPDHPDVAYEEYTNGGVSVTKDGGKTWTSIDPALTSSQFATPFEMDPADANHLIIGGRDIQERLGGPDGSWSTVYDLGTQKQPGVAAATASATDPANQLSAVDVRSYGAGTTTTAPVGPKTADVTYTGGGSTVPDPVGAGLPTSYDDHTITVGPNDGDASMDVKITWALATNDWDLTVYRKAADGTLTALGSSATANPSEEVKIPNPTAGQYVVRVTNYAAVPGTTFTGTVTFTQATSTASSTKKSAAYVGYCGYCDTITQGTPFGNGIATNVVGGQGGTAGTKEQWHIAKAAGLPSRLITSIRMDASDVNTVYVTLAGYGRRWAYPGAVGEDTSKIGTGHVFKSTDAGESFTDITGNLPDTPANWSVVHKGQLVVGTDVGVFIGNDTSGCNYAQAGTGLPTAPVASLRLKPGDQDLLLAASYGRGIYTYRFPADAGPSACPTPPVVNQNPTTTPGTGTGTAPGTGTGTGTTPGAGTGGGTTGAPASTCAALNGFKSVKVTPARKGLRFTVQRAIKQPYTVDVFQQATGSTVQNEHLVKRFTGKTGSFTWTGVKDKAGHRLTSGAYFARLTIKGPGVRDTRRVALTGGAAGFHLRRDFYARASCKLLRTAKLSGPTWGGKTNRSLGIAFRFTRSGTAVVTIRRGTKAVKTVKIASTGTGTHRITLPAKGRTRGDYAITIAGTAGSLTEKVTLVSRKL